MGLAEELLQGCNYFWEHIVLQSTPDQALDTLLSPLY